MQTRPLPNPASYFYFWVVWIFSIALLAAEISYQYFFDANRNLVPAIISGAAFAGGTLIAVALFSSAIFKWYPRLAMHWRIRRYLGVSGTACVIIHVWSVVYFSFGGNIRQILYSWNPFENALIFGLIAYTILLTMFLTSTDWAMRTMGPKRWKFLHRFIYIGFPAAIFHYMTMNPTIYRDLPGFLLVSMTILAVVGQLFWFFKTIKLRQYRNAGTYVGAAIILAVAMTAYFAFFK